MSDLKQLSEKDRLYLEMKGLHEKMGRLLHDYEAASFVEEQNRKIAVVRIINPETGKPFFRIKKNLSKRGKPSRGSRR